MSLSCGAFLSDCALKHERVPAELRCALCVSVSLFISHSHAPQSLFHFPLVTLGLFSLLPLSVSCCYAFLSLSICTLGFIAAMWCACHSWDAFLSFSLSHRFPRSLAASLAGCVSVYISLLLYVSGWISVSASSSHSPHLSLSACCI